MFREGGAVAAGRRSNCATVAGSVADENSGNRYTFR